MRHISVSEAKKRFAALLDAVQRCPVVIRRRSCDQAVLISPQEYARLRGVALADLQAFCVRVGERAERIGLTERQLAELTQRDATAHLVLNEAEEPILGPSIDKQPMAK